MSREGWIHGPTVDKETREVRYLSSSSLQLADMTTEKGCLRKWWYAYVLGLKEEQTWQQAAGTKDHACAEAYMETGQRVFTPRVAKGIHMLPPPGTCEIEHDMVPFQWTNCSNKAKDHKHTYDCPPCPPEDHDHDDKCHKVSGLHLAPLRAAGIPVVGRIDLMHDLGLNYGTEAIEATKDPEGTVEVFDHKFTKDLRYALKGTDMLKNIQMVAYAEYVFRTIPGVKQIRLSHGYYPTNGNARKATILTTRDPISRFWSEHVEPLARSIADAAKETNPDNVKANTKACEAFGRVCMHADRCSAGMQLGLSAQVGGSAAQGLLQIIKKPKDPSSMPLIPGKGLLAHIKKPASDDASRVAELARLKAEEAAAKKKSIVPEWFEDTWNAILAYDKGQPHLGAEAAKIYAAYKGYEDWNIGKGYGGTGELGENVNLSKVEEIQDLLAELKEAFGEPPAKSEPEPEPTPAKTVAAGILPDDAPVTTAPAPTVEANGTVVSNAPPPVEKVKAPRKTRTAKPKVIETTAVETPVEKTETPVVINVKMAEPDPRDHESTVADEKLAAALALDTRVNLLVDVAVEGTQFLDFAVMVDTLAAAIAQRFNVVDIRTGGNDSPLGFGKWKGVIAAAIRETDIDPGTYHIDARGNEIYEEAAQALRQVVKRTGGYYVRGMR